MVSEHHKKDLSEIQEQLKLYKRSAQYLAVRMNKEINRKGSKIYGHKKEFTPTRVYNVFHGSIRNEDMVSTFIVEARKLIKDLERVEKSFLS